MDTTRVCLNEFSSRDSKCYGSIAKNRSINTLNEESIARKIKAEYESYIYELQEKISSLEEDLQYYQAEHQRELENLKIIMECELNKKLFSVKYQLRKSYEDMEAENKRMKKEVQAKS